MSMGVDTSEVKPSGKPKTVGLENSCKPTSSRSDVEGMFRDLLVQLVSQIHEDGRIPQAMKVTVRKYCIVKKLSFKETKQLTLLPSNFRTVNKKLELTKGADESIVKQVMKSFDLMVAEQKFLVNLIGLCFLKFQQQLKGSGSIANFLVVHKEEPGKNFEEKIVKGQTLVEATLYEQKNLPPAKRRKIETSELSPTKNDFVSTIDHSAWQAIPLDIQRELLNRWQTKNKPSV